MLKKGITLTVVLLFIGMSVTPIINGNIWISNAVRNSNIIEEKTIFKSLPRWICNKTFNENQKYFGSYPTGGSFVWFYHPPRELEWEYNIESFNGTINKFNLLATDNSNHSWNLSRFELHINGVNCSNPDNQSFYRKYWAYYQWEITWDNLSEYCNGVVLFEIIYLDCIWIHSEGDLDGDGDAAFHYSYYNPYSYINGTLDGENEFDSDKAYIVWYTPSGKPPDVPSKPSGNTSGYICINHNYSTFTIDPDGLNVSYGWDWDGDLIVDEWTDWYESNETCTIAHNWSDPGDYNISVKAKNTLEIESNWSSQLNVTMLNHPPYIPSNPFPEDGGYDVPINVILNWTGGDPDPCDTLTYDVFFGVTFPPTKKISNQTCTSYEPFQLEICTKYYWQIITWDNHGVCTTGPIWSFTTFCVNFPPDIPVIDGPSSGTRGETYIYSFDADDLEGHDIYYFVDWDDGTNTSWLGIYESGEKIYVNHTWSEKGTYEISARAKDVYDAIGDWGTLEVNMPKNQQVSNTWFLRWLERFPILQRLLDILGGV